jgi:gamma-aminobutyric acid type B receptor
MRGGVSLSTKLLLLLQFLSIATVSSLNETEIVTNRTNSFNKTQVQTTEGRNSVSNSNKTLYLLVLLPYPDLTGGPQPSWSGGPNVRPAIEMAVEDINRKPDVLQGYTLDLIHGDSGCNIIDRASTSFVENVFYQRARGKEPVGIIGPGCSASTLHTAPLAGRDDVALISAHGASTPDLDNREKYPYVFGGFTSLKVYAQAIAGFLQERKWNKVGVLYDSSRVFHKKAFAEIDTILSNDANTKIGFASGIYPHFLPVDQIRDKLLKVTIVLAGPKVVRKILCLSYHQGLTFPTHQFLIIERHLPELITEDIHFEYNERNYNCSNDTMAMIMEGNLLTEYRVSPLDEKSPSTINETSYEQFKAEYGSRIQQRQKMEDYQYRESIMESIWGAMWYDMVWAMAMALNNAELHEGINLQTYGIGMKNVTSKIYRQFQELDFNGISGRIVFSDNSTFVHRQVDVYQVNDDGKPVNVAVINGSEVTDLTDGNYTMSEYPTKTHCIHTAATVMVLFIVSIILIALLITHMVMIKWRHNATVKGSSPRLQHLAYFGCYLLIAATLSLFVPKAFKLGDEAHLVFCHIMNMCFSCGYTLIIGTVCAKTWRLYRIFCHYQKPGKLLADHWLLAIILTLTLVDVVGNIIWATTDHFKIETHMSFENIDNNNNATMVIVIETMCTSRHRIAWTSAITCYNVGILIVAVCLAILTRKVHLPQFQTKLVVILAYMLFLLFGLGVPLKLILDNPYLWIGMFLLTVLLCLFLLFLPPLLPTLSKRKYSSRVHAQNLIAKTSVITLFSHPAHTG